MKWIVLASLLCSAEIQASSLSRDMAQLKTKHQLAGILAARIKNGQIAHLAASGCAKYARDDISCARKLTPDTFVRVASISKLVTALGVMKLAEQGKIRLEADASKYLGFKLRNPAFPDKVITVRMLLAHTSSLRDGAAYWVDYGGKLEELMDDADRFDTLNPPGEYFTYTNLNYGLLGQIIENASGERFDHYMQRHIFAPLGVQAGFNWSGLDTLPGKQVGILYRKKYEEDTSWNPQGPWIEQIDDFDGKSPKPKGRGYEGDPKNYKIGTNGTLFAPQGGLRISLRQLAKITAYLASADNATLRDMAKPVWTYKKTSTRENGNSEGGFFLSYGAGPQLYRGGKQAFPKPVPSHFADAYGLRGGLLYDPATKNGWIYLITGFSDEPMNGPAAKGCAYPGLAPAEADVVCALWRHK